MVCNLNNSLRMKLNNPMKNKLIVKKVMNTKKINHVYEKMAKNAIGKKMLKESILKRQKTYYKNNQHIKSSNRMKINNPMFRVNIKQKMKNTFKNKTFKEREIINNKILETKNKTGCYKNMSKNMKKNNPMFNENTVKKMVKTMYELWPNKKSGLEKKYEKIFYILDKKIEFVGNGSVWIKRQNPDFILRSKKKVIEMTSHWFYRTKNNYAINRIKKYNECNWNCLVIFIDKDKFNDSLRLQILDYLKHDYSGVIEYGKLEKI